MLNKSTTHTTSLSLSQTYNLMHTDNNKLPTHRQQISPHSTLHEHMNVPPATHQLCPSTHNLHTQINEGSTTFTPYLHVGDEGPPLAYKLLTGSPLTRGLSCLWKVLLENMQEHKASAGETPEDTETTIFQCMHGVRCRNICMLHVSNTLLQQ